MLRDFRYLEQASKCSMNISLLLQQVGCSLVTVVFLRYLKIKKQYSKKDHTLQCKQFKMFITQGQGKE